MTLSEAARKALDQAMVDYEESNRFAPSSRERSDASRTRGDNHVRIAEVTALVSIATALEWFMSVAKEKEVQ